MGRIVGIDLGTTYSAVAIPEDRVEDGFITVPSCPGYSVILDPVKIRLTPSVVAEDYAGNLLVGRRAKNRAGLLPDPVMFAKRSIGEDVIYNLNKHKLTPTEVSAEILKYLKKITEDRLKEPVDEAVITVPAYFNLPAKQATEEAGRLAGLNVMQIAYEPVAAALMYCIGDMRDPLRVMTYDLGGGTFDVAVLEKRGGTFTPDTFLTFDGDRFLGGYNFDSMLVDWLVEQINSRGYDLILNPNNPQDRISRARLMVIAEETKIKLSDQESFLFQNLPTGITDHKGNLVNLEGLFIDRAAFEIMIEPKIDYSIALCFRALSKADPPISKESLDEILMVGGSSRIPMVMRKLEEAFGRKPRLVEPDLCVALGAAILAGVRSKAHERLQLDTIPQETDMPWITITGRLEGEAIGESLSGYVVMLIAADGSFQRTLITNGDGTFAFEEVNLTPEAESVFTFSAYRPDGSQMSSRSFRVRQSARVRIESSNTPFLLSRPIFLEDFDGYHVITPERTPLPFRQQMVLKTSDTSGIICFGIREENNLLGEILITDIPQTLPVGSEIDIDILIQNNYQIQARAYVPALALASTVVIDIPIPPVKSLAEIEANLQKLTDRVDEMRRSLGPKVLSSDARLKRLQSLLIETKELIQINPNLPLIQDRLDEIEILIRDLNAGPRVQPPRSTFDARVNEAWELLEQAISHKPHMAQEGFDRQIEMICSEAETAYQAQNLGTWKDVYFRLESLCKRLEGLLPPPPPPDPITLLLSLGSNLATLERKARDDGKYEMFHAEFEKLANHLKQIDPKSPDAMILIHDWFFAGYEELRKGLDTRLSVYEQLHPDARSEKLAKISEKIREMLEDPKASGSPYGFVSSKPSFGIMSNLPSIEPRQDFESFVSDVPTRPERRPEVPGLVDRVHFSVTAPPQVNPGASFVVDLWAHLEKQRLKVIQRAREAAGGAEVLVKTKGPLPVARGTVLTVHLAIDALTIEDPEDTILWEGEIGNASFAVQVTKDAIAGNHLGKAVIYADAVQIARVNFELTVAPAKNQPLPEPKPLPVQEFHHRTAFASYASADRDEVLHCIHGMQKAAPSMEIFIDVHSLRSGQNWEKELWTRIPSSDIFFLFWSVNAKQSPWVEKEWRCALNARGLDFIDPVPLQSPEVAPPPTELASLHFNDWQLAYLRNAPK